MLSKQVQIFVPLLCRSDTTGLSAGIQAPTSRPACHTQPAASMATAAGDTDPVLEVTVGIFHHPDPSHLLMPGQGQQELGHRLGREEIS